MIYKITFNRTFPHLWKGCVRFWPYLSRWSESWVDITIAFSKNEQCTFMIVRVAGFVFLACVGWNAIQCFYLIPTEAQILRGCLTLKAPWVWVVKSACLLSPLWALNPHSLQLLTYVSLLLFEVFFYSAFYQYFLSFEERHTATDNRNHWITAQGHPS